MSIRVLVADDQDLVRTGLRLILGTLDGIDVVGEARDGQEAVRLARELRPDVCLMDIRMPVLDGVEATRLLAGPGVADPVAVVVITTVDLDEYVHGALSAGATGFLLKDAGPELLGEAIRAATRGPASRRVASTPSRTGIRMSIRHTSGRSSRASRTASCPSRASPTTSMPSRVPRISRSPVRTRSWSSATSTRMLIDVVTPAPAAAVSR